jgi:hypothetical protein
VANSSEHGNEYSGCIKGDIFLEPLNDYKIFKDTSRELVYLVLISENIHIKFIIRFQIKYLQTITTFPLRDVVFNK